MTFFKSTENIAMNYLMIVLSLVLAGASQAQTCKTSITPDTPDRRFRLDDNLGTAFDKKTGLTWMRCALGQNWNNATKTCYGLKEFPSWQGALNAAEAAGFAGFSDWRLPNFKELSSIVEGRCYAPAINLTVFPSEGGDKFWSASPYADSSLHAWIVNFNDGGGDGGDKFFSYAVRLVRGRE
jgi:hypothetical protein